MTDSETNHAEKIETKKSKEISYTYWVKPNNPDVKIDIAPQKIQSVAELKKETSGKAPSVWNSSGTWEQKKISIAEIQNKLSAALANVNTTDGKATIEKVKVTGEAHFFFSRGKKSMSYELRITLEYKETGEGDAKGEVVFEEFTDHGDRDYSIKPKGGANKEAVRNSVGEDVKNWIKLIEVELAKIRDE